MCYRNKCQAPGVHGLNVCQQHLSEIQGVIKDACTALSDNECADYAKIWCVIMDGVTLNTALNYLGDQLDGFAAKVARIDAVTLDELPVLHFLLKSYEEKFGFGRDCVMTGILTEEAFLAQLNDAYVVCDFGADADHGAFTHRLQWFGVMYAATGGNPGNGTPGREGQLPSWSTPVVNLYKALGTARAATNKRMTLPKADGQTDGGANLWAALFDIGGSAGRYNHPDGLHAAVRGGKLGGSQLMNAILAVQKEVVDRRIRVLNTLQFIGAAQINPRHRGEGSENISERDDLIQRAIVGGNIVQLMKFRDVQDGIVSTGEFKSDLATPAGSFYAGNHEVKGDARNQVSAAAIRNLANSLVAGGRWKPQYANLLVRKQRLNSMGEIVDI